MCIFSEFLLYLKKLPGRKCKIIFSIYVTIMKELIYILGVYTFFMNGKVLFCFVYKIINIDNNNKNNINELIIINK